MYANQKSFYQIVAVAIIVMILMALIGTTFASAESSQPPKKDKKVVVPHQNPKQDGKPMNVSCHSKHAREAGIVCGEKEKDTRPLPQPTNQTSNTTQPSEKRAKYHVFPETTASSGSAGGSHIKYMM